MLILNTKLREQELGTRKCRQLRRKGFIPAAISYSEGRQSKSITLDANSVYNIINNEKLLDKFYEEEVKLVINDNVEEVVRMKKIEINHPKNKVHHIDFVKAKS